MQLRVSLTLLVLLVLNNITCSQELKIVRHITSLSLLKIMSFKQRIRRRFYLTTT